MEDLAGSLKHKDKVGSLLANVITSIASSKEVKDKFFLNKFH
jgi:hypothetical protein